MCATEEASRKSAPATSELKPGSHTVRPTRTEAEESEDIFYNLLEWSRHREGLSLKNIAKVLGDTAQNSESNISRKITNRTLPDEMRQLLLRHMFGEGVKRVANARARVRKEPHALYFALLDFAGTRETSQDNARASIEGTFKFWRHSVDHPGEYVFAKLVFSEDPSTRAVTVRMHQAKQAVDGGRGSHSHAEGYFFKVGGAYLMLLHDQSNREFRVTLFSSFRSDWVGVEVGPDGRQNARSVYAGRRLHIVELDGYVLGIDGNRNFFSPIHATLVDDVDELAKLDDQIDVIAPGDTRLPRRVAAKLTQGGSLKIF